MHSGNLSSSPEIQTELESVEYSCTYETAIELRQTLHGFVAETVESRRLEESGQVETDELLAREDELLRVVVVGELEHLARVPQRH